MRCGQDGFTTLEALLALVVFTLGALGATASVAFATRLAQEGSQAARAGRLLQEESARLVAEIAGAGGSCAAARPGSRTGQAGLQLSSTLFPVMRGRDLRMVITYPTAGGPHTDSASGFLVCH
jgi:type II secretory pathway component PulJ